MDWLYCTYVQNLSFCYLQIICTSKQKAYYEACCVWKDRFRTSLHLNRALFQTNGAFCLIYKPLKRDSTERNRCSFMTFHRGENKTSSGILSPLKTGVFWGTVNPPKRCKMDALDQEKLECGGNKEVWKKEGKRFFSFIFSLLAVRKACQRTHCSLTWMTLLLLIVNVMPSHQVGRGFSVMRFTKKLSLCRVAQTWCYTHYISKFETEAFTHCKCLEAI